MRPAGNNLFTCRLPDEGNRAVRLPLRLRLAFRRCGSSSRTLPRPGAFTLIELLVVLGIIAVLLSLLLPSLSRAREQAKSLQCLSNLRQMTIAAAAYCSENRGFFPSSHYRIGSLGGPQWDYGWDFTHAYDPATNLTATTAGLLWSSGGGKGSLAIQQCPNYEGPSNSTVEEQFTGYNYNTSYIGHGQDEAIPTPAKANQLRHPARTAIFGDGQYANGANKYMRAPFPNPGDATFTGRYGGTQGFRHLKKTNAAFADGHAETLPSRYTNSSDSPAQIAPGTGFLSPDNSLYSLE